MPDLEYEAKEWLLDGRRNLLLDVRLGVMPYVRQTRTTRWRDHPSGERARAYNEAKAELSHALFGIMLAERLKPFGAIPLGMDSSFWVKYPKKMDLGNLEKCLEDAGNTVLYPDDRWIFARGVGGKYGGEPRFTLHLWEIDANPGQGS